MNRQLQYGKCMWVWIIGIGISLLLTACVAGQSPAKPVIKLAVNSWETSKINVAVAKILLEEEMGYPVEIVEVDENDQWALLAQGDLHANLEIWSSGHSDDFRYYVQEEKSVVYGGPLGVVGKISWFVPSYVARSHPELVSWEGFQDPANIALFATEETGSKGQFLAGDPAWVQYDEDIIRNLGLDLQVVYVGSEENLLAELEAAYEEEAPILLYFWIPHWVYIIYDLVPVALPAYSDECYSQLEEGGINCDYPEDVLYKIMWSGLDEYAPDASQFLKNFSYTNQDQVGMLAQVEVHNRSYEEVAQTWIEANEAVWRSWLP